MATREIKARGVGLSRWNTVKDYAKMKAAGVEFAIIKESYGVDGKEPKYETHLAGCKAAGITVPAAYIYCYSNTVEKAQKAADAFMTNTKGEIPTMVLDLEDKTMKGLGSLIVDIINTFRSVATANGLNFIIYTGASYYNPCLKAYKSQIADIPIWWARYPSSKQRKITDDVPTLSAYNLPNELVGWQYSSKGQIDGVSGNVDMNVWYTDFASTTTTKRYDITVDHNPFTEPTEDIKKGSRGDGAGWVQWYLWRFGLFTKDGAADVSQIDCIIGDKSVEAIKVAQFRLGLPVTGIVTATDRETFKKVC